MSTEAQKAASRRYNENNVKQVTIKLNLEHDADILRKLETVGSKQAYIKSLIRKEMK